MPSLRCKDLCKWFGGTQALADVTVDFQPSVMHAIIGPNGAGKTTLLNVMTGMLRPDRGLCFVQGWDTTGLPLHRVARLGVARTFQDVRLIFGLSVIENVLLACSEPSSDRLIHAFLPSACRADDEADRVKATSLLRSVALDGHGNSRAGDLSYGQQKLVALACCLARDPSILLLDEPVAGIAPAMIQRLVDLLKGLRDEGRLIVFVEHNLSTVRDLADRVVVMDEGRIVADGQPGVVLESPEIIEAYLE